MSSRVQKVLVSVAEILKHQKNPSLLELWILFFLRHVVLKVDKNKDLHQTCEQAQTESSAYGRLQLHLVDLLWW
jgi:hypothetical protein